MPPGGSIEEIDAVCSDQTESSHLDGIEAAAPRIQFRGITSRKNPLIHHDHRALAACLRRSRDANRSKQVQRAVRADSRWRSLRADQDDRAIRLYSQMQKEGSLIQTRGAVSDDNAREIAAFSKEIVDTASQLQPVCRSDRGACDVRELFGLDARIFPRFRNGCHDLRDGTPDLVGLLSARISLLAGNR